MVNNIVAFSGSASKIASLISTWQATNKNKSVIDVNLKGASCAGDTYANPEFVAIITYV
jgi:hypothetical protein